MSAIPEAALSPQSVSPFLRGIAERTDDALLTDREVYKLKGGDFNFLIKAGVGFGAVAGYLIFTRRIKELLRFQVSASTFIFSNLIFLSSASFYQAIYDSSSGNHRRLNLHRSALTHRFISNYSFMAANRKKPIIH